MPSNPKRIHHKCDLTQKIHHKCDPTPKNKPQMQSNPKGKHHKYNPIPKECTTIVRVYRSSFCSYEIFCIYSLFETCSSDIYLAFVFGGGWLEEETGAFTPTNGHYWDPIATHHTTLVPSVSIFYFLLLYLSTSQFSICFSIMYFLHMLTLI